jgi:transcriptional regulator with XRE-family HTH domain
MSSSPDERRRFGAVLKATRKKRGLTQKQVIAAMAAAGDDLTESALSDYEKGKYAPGRQRALLLDETLEGDGAIASQLGFVGPARTAGELVDILERIEALRSEAVKARGYELPSDRFALMRRVLREAAGEDATLVHDPEELTAGLADLEFEVRRQFHDVRARLDQIETAMGLQPPPPVDGSEWLPPELDLVLSDTPEGLELTITNQEFALAAEGGGVDPGDEGTVSGPSGAPEEND